MALLFSSFLFYLSDRKLLIYSAITVHFIKRFSVGAASAVILPVGWIENYWTHGRPRCTHTLVACSQFDSLMRCCSINVSSRVATQWFNSLSSKTCFRFINAFVYQLVCCNVFVFFFFTRTTKNITERCSWSVAWKWRRRYRESRAGLIFVIDVCVCRIYFGSQLILVIFS